MKKNAMTYEDHEDWDARQELFKHVRESETAPLELRERLADMLRHQEQFNAGIGSGFSSEPEMNAYLGPSEDAEQHVAATLCAEPLDVPAALAAIAKARATYVRGLARRER